MKMLLKILLTAALLLAQGAGEIPPFEGDGNPEHANHPKWCQSKDAKGYKANCSCDNAKRSCDDRHGDSKCRTFCRRAACSCAPNCMPSGR